MRALECRVLQRNRNFPIDKEEGMKPKLGPERRGEPHPSLLPLIYHVEADPGQIRPQHSAHKKWNPPRQLGEYADRLEFGCIDVRLSRPRDFVVILGTKGDVIQASSCFYLLPKQLKFVVLLFFARQRE